MAAYLSGTLAYFLLGEENTNRNCQVVRGAWILTNIFVYFTKLLTSNILYKDKVEHIVSLYHGLADDHAGDVGDQEHEAQAENTDKVVLLLFSGLLWSCSAWKEDVSNADDDLKDDDSDGSHHCGNNNGNQDWENAECVEDLVVDGTRNINFLAEDVISEETVDEWYDPDAAQGHLVQERETRVKLIIVILIISRIQRHHNSLLNLHLLLLNHATHWLEHRTGVGWADHVGLVKNILVSN